MNDEIQPQYPHWESRVEIRMSLQIQFPGMADPLFLEGMTLSVDRYMYERYKDMDELDRWLGWQAMEFVRKHTRVRRVAIDRPWPTQLGEGA